MKLIDATRASEAMIEHFKRSPTTATRAKSIIEEQPTIDAVEVVRCKDCEEWGPSMVMHGRGVCAEWSDYDNGRIRLTEGNDYCSYGERSEETASDYYDNEGRLINNQPTCMSVCGERRSDD